MSRRKGNNIKLPKYETHRIDSQDMQQIIPQEDSQNNLGTEVQWGKFRMSAISQIKQSSTLYST